MIFTFKLLKKYFNLCFYFESHQATIILDNPLSKSIDDYRYVNYEDYYFPTGLTLDTSKLIRLSGIPESTIDFFIRDKKVLFFYFSEEVGGSIDKPDVRDVRIRFFYISEDGEIKDNSFGITTTNRKSIEDNFHQIGLKKLSDARDRVDAILKL